MAVYDPHAHRMVTKVATNLDALMHLLKGALGTGILAMPEAYMHSGIIVGIIGTIIITALCAYGIHILMRTNYILCKRKLLPQMTYPIAMRTALEDGPPSLRCMAPVAVPFVDGFLILYQCGICACYVVFVAANIQQVIEAETNFRADLRVHMLFYFVPMALIMCLRNLKVLAPCSALANALIFISLIVILYYVFKDFPDTSDRHMVGNLKEFPLFIGTTLFALEAVGVIISVEQNMETPKSFGGYFGVFNQSMLAVGILYGFVGLVGYIKFGPNCLGSITLNLPATDRAAKAVKILYALAVFVSYSLQGYVPFEILWYSYIRNRIENSKKLMMYEYILRFGIVIVTFLMALAIPNVGLFTSLIGALCLSMLGFSLPSLMEICVLYPNSYGRFNYILWKDVLLILFGFCAMILGVTITIIALIEA